MWEFKKEKSKKPRLEFAFFFVESVGSYFFYFAFSRLLAWLRAHLF